MHHDPSKHEKNAIDNLTDFRRVSSPALCGLWIRALIYYSQLQKYPEYDVTSDEYEGYEDEEEIEAGGKGKGKGKLKERVLLELTEEEVSALSEPMSQARI